ncbi:hypothetical protein [Roseovarius salinarum]|nr:hypothetical protein [Roseovarius salinarum]
MVTISGTGRHETLIAAREDSNDMPVHRFDIRLKSDNETVSFDI